MSESLFNKVASLKVYNFIKKWLQHRFFTVNIRSSNFEEHQRMAATIDSSTFFNLNCFDFRSTAVQFKITIKTCLLGQ